MQLPERLGYQGPSVPGRVRCPEPGAGACKKQPPGTTGDPGGFGENKDHGGVGCDPEEGEE